MFSSLCEFSISLSLSGDILYICWYSKLNVDPVGVVENGFRICSVILLPICLFRNEMSMLSVFLNMAIWYLISLSDNLMDICVFLKLNVDPKSVGKYGSR